MWYSESSLVSSVFQLCIIVVKKTPDLLLACLDSQSLIDFWSFQWWPDVQICRLFHYERNEGCILSLGRRVEKVGSTNTYIEETKKKTWHARACVDSCIKSVKTTILDLVISTTRSTTTTAAAMAGHAATTTPTKSVAIIAVAVWRRTHRPPRWRLRVGLQVKTLRCGDVLGTRRLLALGPALQRTRLPIAALTAAIGAAATLAPLL